MIFLLCSQKFSCNTRNEPVVILLSEHLTFLRKLSQLDRDKTIIIYLQYTKFYISNLE